MPLLAGVWLTVGLSTATSTTAAATASSAERLAGLQAVAIRAVMRRAADRQLGDLRPESRPGPQHRPGEWPNAVFYAGLMATYHATGDEGYRRALLEVGERLRWRPGRRLRHADDHAVAQTYLDLARLEAEPRMYAPFRTAIDRMMAAPARWPKRHQPIDYWWSDALFMSPPALAKLTRLTGDDRYLDFADRLWREAYELLWDAEARLFHRDLRYREAAGAPVFWSRGNGWVLAGLARLLDELPADRPSRRFYEDVFGELASRAAALQGPDGLWRASLLDETGAPGETSGTALFCHGMAWGVRRGLLDRGLFLPHAERAWIALHERVDDSGRLGWVQGIGSEPAPVTADDTGVYGTGAFLLAGAEVLGLVEAASGSAVPSN